MCKCSRLHNRRRWKKLKRKHLDDFPNCREHADRDADDVDHVTPCSEGGGDDPDNLQSLCGECLDEKDRADHRRDALTPRTVACARMDADAARKRRKRERSRLNPQPGQSTAAA